MKSNKNVLSEGTKSKIISHKSISKIVLLWLFCCPFAFTIWTTCLVFLLLVGLRIKKTKVLASLNKMLRHMFNNSYRHTELLTATTSADEEYILAEAAGKGDIYSNANFQYQ